jgi:aryl-alcohol dehydrogenase-like predicted oxidoreductase
MDKEIKKQPFGSTGQLSSRAIFGSVSLRYAREEEAERVLEIILEYGVNHIDTAPRYGNAELRVGTWMKRYRDRFFLATKVDQSTYKDAREQLYRSLDRLQTDHVDLLQVHNLTDVVFRELAMGPEGTFELLTEAQENGLTRFIGITGHGAQAPLMHLQSLERFRPDSVLVPCNYLMMQIPQYREHFARLVESCRQKNIAVQTIKAAARGLWGDASRNHITWYEPLNDQHSVNHAVHWVMGHTDAFLITTGDSEVLPKFLEAAASFTGSPSQEQMDTLVRAYGMMPLFNQ